MIFATLEEESEEKKEKREANVVVDGPHTYFYCSYCSAPLLDVWETGPAKSAHYLARAECPHCGDHSDVAPINSEFFNMAPIIPRGQTEPYTGLDNWDIIKINGKEVMSFTGVKVREWKCPTK